MSPAFRSLAFPPPAAHPAPPPSPHDSGHPGRLARSSHHFSRRPLAAEWWSAVVGISLPRDPSARAPLIRQRPYPSPPPVKMSLDLRWPLGTMRSATRRALGGRSAVNFCFVALGGRNNTASSLIPADLRHSDLMKARPRTHHKHHCKCPQKSSRKEPANNSALAGQQGMGPYRAVSVRRESRVSKIMKSFITGDWGGIAAVALWVKGLRMRCSS